MVNLHRFIEEAKLARAQVFLCSVKIANNALKKGGQLFLCTPISLIHIQKGHMDHEQFHGDSALHALLTEFQDALTQELPRGLPPSRTMIIKSTLFRVVLHRHELHIK